jgi:hypothetical protein
MPNNHDRARKLRRLAATLRTHSKHPEKYGPTTLNTKAELAKWGADRLAKAAKIASEADKLEPRLVATAKVKAAKPAKKPAAKKTPAKKALPAAKKPLVNRNRRPKAEKQHALPQADVAKLEAAPSRVRESDQPLVIQ